MSLHQSPEKRAEALAALRELLTRVEADPALPAPDFIGFPGGNEASGDFEQLHDVADTFGIEVVEESRDLSRELKGSFGPLSLYMRVSGDYRRRPDTSSTRVVQRPPREPSILHVDWGDAQTYGYREGIRRTACGTYEPAASTVSDSAYATCQGCIEAATEGTQ